MLISDKPSRVEIQARISARIECFIQTSMQSWSVSADADMAQLFFPDMASGEQPVERVSLLDAVISEQRDTFQRTLDTDTGILQVAIVDLADGVDRMAASWPWPVDSVADLPFVGIALTPSLLPGAHQAALQCIQPAMRKCQRRSTASADRLIVGLGIR